MDENDILIKRHNALGVYCVYILIATSIFDLTIEVTGRISNAFHTSTFFTGVSMVIYSLFFARMIKKTGYSLKTFGFTTERLPRYMLESVVLSIIFCFIITGFKWILISYTESFSHLSLLHRPNFGNSDLNWLVPLLYVLLVPIQVFLSQGVVQSPLLQFLPHKNRNWISVLVATLLFAAFHIELNMIFALGVAIPGLFWATMYLRHRTLITIIGSHIIIGLWGLFCLDFKSIFDIIFAMLPLSNC